MGRRKISIKKTAADNIAAIAWFIESKGMAATAERFTDADYILLIQIPGSFMLIVKNRREHN